MADFPIYRLVKGSQLTFTEMDNNLKWLSANMSSSLNTISGSVLVSVSGSGSGIFKINSAFSNLATVQEDSFSGSLFPSSSIFSVNDIMGLPILDIFYDSRLAMYQYPDTIFEKSGSSLYFGSTHTTESKVIIKNNLTIDRGSGVAYQMIQSSGSTVSLVTSSIDRYFFGNTSASLYYSAVVSGYDTGSREMIVGEVKSTIKFANGVATLIGSNTKYLNTEDSTVNFDIVCGGTSASLQVYGSTNKVYNWAATITTQKF